MTKVTYPRTVVIDDPKLKRTIEERALMLEEVVKSTKKISKFEKDITKLEQEYKDIQATVDISEFTAIAAPKKEQIKKLIDEVNMIVKEANKKRLKAVPKDLIVKFDKARESKAEEEQKRRKLGLRVKKWKDKVSSVVDKVVKPQLTKYENIERVLLENGKPVVKIISSLDEYDNLLKK